MTWHEDELHNPDGGWVFTPDNTGQGIMKTQNQTMQQNRDKCWTKIPRTIGHYLDKFEEE